MFSVFSIVLVSMQSDTPKHCMTLALRQPHVFSARVPDLTDTRRASNLLESGLRCGLTLGIALVLHTTHLIHKCALFLLIYSLYFMVAIRISFEVQKVCFVFVRYRYSPPNILPSPLLSSNWNAEIWKTVSFPVFHRAVKVDNPHWSTSWVEDFREQSNKEHLWTRNKSVIRNLQLTLKIIRRVKLRCVR